MVAWLQGIECGTRQGLVEFASNETTGVAASATVTISSGSGTITAVVAGVSCAVTWATSDTNTATLLKNKINASTARNQVVATSSSGVVTVSSLAPYDGLGHLITLTATGTGATASAATLGGDVGVAATGTFTTASGSGTQTAVINGVSIAITWATDDTTSAALMAAAINASTNALVAGHVTATSALGVVTVTAVEKSKLGNAITTTATGTGFTAEQARLTGGKAIAYVSYQRG